MSATMDAQMFADYFGPNTPILTIPGTLMKQAIQINPQKMRI